MTSGKTSKWRKPGLPPGYHHNTSKATMCFIHSPQLWPLIPMPFGLAGSAKNNLHKVLKYDWHHYHHNTKRGSDITFLNKVCRPAQQDTHPPIVWPTTIFLSTCPFSLHPVWKILHQDTTCDCKWFSSSSIHGKLISFKVWTHKFYFCSSINMKKSCWCTSTVKAEIV